MKQARLSIVIEGQSYAFDNIPPELRERYADSLADDNHNGIPDSIEKFVDANGADSTEIVMRLDSSEAGTGSPEMYRDHFQNLMDLFAGAGNGPEEGITSLLEDLNTSPMYHFEISTIMLPADLQKELVNRHNVKRSRLLNARIVADFEPLHGWSVKLDDVVLAPESRIYNFIIDEIQRIESGKRSFLEDFSFGDFLELGQLAKEAASVTTVDTVQQQHTGNDDKDTHARHSRPRTRQVSHHSSHSSEALERHIREQLGGNRRSSFLDVLILLLLVALVAVAGYWYLFQWLPGQG